MDKGGVSRQVQHLVDLGLVERTPDPDDGRATCWSASTRAAAGSTTVEPSDRRELARRAARRLVGDDGPRPTLRPRARPLQRRACPRRPDAQLAARPRCPAAAGRRPDRWPSAPRPSGSSTGGAAAVEHDGDGPRRNASTSAPRSEQLDRRRPRSQANVAAGRQRRAVERQRRVGVGRPAASTVSVGPVGRLRDPRLRRCPARSRTARWSPPHGIGTRQPSRPTSPVRKQDGSCAVLRGDVDLLEAELLALVEVRRAGQREHRQRGGAGAGQARLRRRRTASTWRTTSWLLSTHVGEAPTGVDARRACR